MDHVSPREVFADALREGGGLHSPLYRWLYEHHDAVTFERSRHLVTWDALARQFALRGVGHHGGGVASAASLRVTWSRVRRAVQRERAQGTGQAVDARRVATGRYGIVPAEKAIDVPEREIPTPVGHPPPSFRAASGEIDASAVMMPTLEDHADVAVGMPAACVDLVLVPDVVASSTTKGGGDDATSSCRNAENEDDSAPKKKRRMMW